VFRVYLDPLIQTLCRIRRLSREEARDALVDVVLSYLTHPGRFDPRKGRLHSYLTQAAVKKTTDTYRREEARQRREQKFGGVFELLARTPNDSLEITVEARLFMERIDRAGLPEKDRAFLKLVLQGERSTHILAEAIGLPPAPEADHRREVKRHRDRLMKFLGRLGKEDRDVYP